MQKALFLLNPLQMCIRAKENRVIHERRSCQSAAFQFVNGQRLEFLSGSDDGGCAVFIQQIDAAVGKCR